MAAALPAEAGGFAPRGGWEENSMRQIKLGGGGLTAPAVAVGCMRLGGLDRRALADYIHTALEQGVNYFDHADIYQDGACEERFGEAMAADGSIRREDVVLQSKCGIRRGFYDSSREHILRSVEGSLRRLRTDHLDVLLIHRPDALAEPEEVAAAFDELQASGKVLHFGVSNHRPMQIELLKKAVRQELIIDQLQFSLPVSNMVAGGLEVNMETPGSADRDGSVLDWARLHDVTIQAWSPFQAPNWSGCFLGDSRYEKLNAVLERLAGEYGASPTAIAAAWILRHPAGIQLIAGTASRERLAEILRAAEIRLTREQWYELYLAAGHPLP